MKRIRMIWLPAILIAICFQGAAQGLKGSGTQGAPFEIGTAEELNLLRNYTGSEYANTYFALTGDIDLTDYLSEGGAGYNGGKGWDPIGETSTSFIGTFDGRGYTIRGLWINRQDEEYVGLFGYTAGATLKNIHIDIEEKGVGGYQYVGGLVGGVSNKTLISGCSVSGGTVRGYALTGGLAGGLGSSKAEQSFSSVDIEILERLENNGTLTADIGGLVGYTESSTLTDCYSTGNVSPANEDGSYNEQNLHVGGLTGKLNYYSAITRCYAIGIVTSPQEDTGGLVGNLHASTIHSSYYLSSEADKGIGNAKDEAVAGCQNLTLTQMRQAENFVDWFDEANTWSIKENQSAPYLGDPDDYPLWINSEENTTYYYITLTVAPGIELYGLTAGELTVEEGGHLHLQFLPEDPALTAGDVILTIDGVETVFKDMGANSYFTYILNPVTSDHRIEISLREKEDPTGNMEAAAGNVRLATGNGCLIIKNETGTAIDATIYNLRGGVMAARKVPATATIPLPAGTYIVRAGAATRKVMIR